MTNRESITGRKSILLAANFKLFFSLLFVAGLDLSILLKRFKITANFISFLHGPSSTSGYYRTDFYSTPPPSTEEEKSARENSVSLSARHLFSLFES